MSPDLPVFDSNKLLTITSKLTDILQEKVTPYQLLKHTTTFLGLSHAWLIEQYHDWEESHFYQISNHYFSEEECQLYISKQIFQPCHSHISIHTATSHLPQHATQVTFKLTTRENLASIYLYLEFSTPQSQQQLTSAEFILFLNVIRLYFSERAYAKNYFSRTFSLHELYNDMIDDAPFMIYAINEQQQIVMWNKQCEKIFGWSQQELQQFEQPLKLFYPDKKYRDQVFEQTTQRSHLKQMSEWNPLRRDGSMLTSLWTHLQLPNRITLNFGFDITEQRKAEKILKTRASIDGLTQCLNRDEILSQLEELLKHSRYDPIDLPFCVFMLDLDHFKKINDTWGHLAGDKTLTHFSRLLRSHYPKAITVGRFGGEEFLLIMKVASIEEAMEFDRTLRIMLENFPLHYQNHPIALNYSAGVVLVEEGKCNLTNLLSSVDQALYQAKKTGRGQTIQAEQRY